MIFLDFLSARAFLAKASSVLLLVIVLGATFVQAQYLPPASSEDIEYKVNLSGYASQATTSMTLNVSNAPSGFMIQSIDLIFSAPVNKTVLEIYQIRGNATSIGIEAPKADVLKYFAINMFEATNKVEYLVITFSVSMSYLESIGVNPDDLLVAVYMEETSTWVYYSLNITRILSDRVYLEAIVPPSTVYALVKKSVSEITYTVVQTVTNVYTTSYIITSTNAVEETITTTVTAVNTVTTTKTSTYTVTETRTHTKTNTSIILGTTAMVLAIILIASYILTHRK